MVVLILIAIVLDFIIAFAGRKRQIGFGWALFLGTLLSPIVSLIAVLLSDKLDEDDEINWGCLPPIIFTVVSIVVIALVLLGLRGRF